MNCAGQVKGLALLWNFLLEVFKNFILSNPHCFDCSIVKPNLSISLFHAKAICAKTVAIARLWVLCESLRKLKADVLFGSKFVFIICKASIDSASCPTSSTKIGEDRQKVSSVNFSDPLRLRVSANRRRPISRSNWEPLSCNRAVLVRKMWLLNPKKIAGWLTVIAGRRRFKFRF